MTTNKNTTSKYKLWFLAIPLLFLMLGQLFLQFIPNQNFIKDLDKFYKMELFPIQKFKSTIEISILQTNIAINHYNQKTISKQEAIGKIKKNLVIIEEDNKHLSKFLEHYFEDDNKYKTILRDISLYTEYLENVAKSIDEDNVTSTQNMSSIISILNSELTDSMNQLMEDIVQKKIVQYSTRSNITIYLTVVIYIFIALLAISIIFIGIKNIKNPLEKVIIEKESKYKILANYFPRSLIILLDNDYKVSLIEGSIKSLLLKTKSIGIGTKLNHILPQEIFENLQVMIMESFQGYEKEKEFEFEDNFFFVNTVPIKFHNKSIKEIMIVIQKTTEKRNFEIQITKLSKIMEQSPISVMIVNKDYHIEYVNPAFEKITGYSYAETLGQNLNFISSGQIDNYDAIISKVMKGEIWTGEVHSMKKNGITFWESCTFSPIKDNDGKISHVLVLREDISFKKDLEIQLLRSEERFRNLIDNANVGICIINDKNCYEYVNKYYCSIFGYKSKELIGNNFTIVFDEQIKQTLTLEHLKFMETGIEIQRELETKKKTGENVIILFQSIRIYGQDGLVKRVSFVIDLTSRILMESALKESESKYRSLADNMSDGIYFISSDKKVVFFNLAFQTIFGHSLEYFQSDYPKSFISCIYSEDRNLVTNALEKMDTSKDIIDLYYRIIHPENGIRYIRDVLHVIKDENGKVQSFQGIVTDITERHNTEQKLTEYATEIQLQNEQLKNALGKADAANKAKSQFLSNMSHELRTPLNAIIGFSQIIQKDSVIPDRIRGYVSSMYKSAIHLLGMINDILDFSKIEANKLELVYDELNLYQLVDDIKNMFDLQCKNKNIILKVENPQNDREIYSGDIKRLLQVLINLVGNAVKFTSVGNVTLSTEKIIYPFTESILKKKGLDKKLDNTYNIVRFIVKDTGIGMKNEDLDKLFKPFFQADNTSRQGTGLGLAISFKLVKLMGGEFHVESQVNIGTIFTVEIPMKMLEQRERMIEEFTWDMIVGVQGSSIYKILVVDDIESNREVLKAFLEPIGFVCMYAEDGVQAIQLLESYHFDLVLMDIVMPNMDGYQAVEQIRQKLKMDNLPVIAITASGYEGKKDELIKHGFNEYVRKPYTEEELFSQIKKILNIEYLYASKSSFDENDSVQEINVLDKISSEISTLPTETFQFLKESIDIQDFDSVLKIVTDNKNYFTKEAIETIIKAIDESDYKFFITIYNKLD